MPRQSNRAFRKFEPFLVKLLIYLAGPFLSWRRSHSNEKPKRVLFVKSCCFGDAILSLYAIREYRRRHPAINLEMLCSSRVRDIYTHSGLFSRIHALPVEGRKLFAEVARARFLFSSVKLVFRLRRQRYHELIDLELYRTYPMLVKKVLAVPRSRGFSLEGAENKNHDILIDRKKNTPEWKCFFDLLELNSRSDGAPEPLYPNKNALSGEGKSVGIVFGSSRNWPQKKWPLNYYAHLIKALIEADASVVLFGAAYELAESKLLCRAAGGPVENTTGRLKYPDLIARIQNCDLVVGNDTGTMHLAAACGRPTLTLFGPTNPKKWRPVDSEVEYLNDLPCRPCYYLSTMPQCSHRRCMCRMSPGEITQKVLHKLNSLQTQMT